jgi:hypothetical protein
VRALNWITAPFLNLMNSRFSAFMTFSTRSASAALLSNWSMNFANVSRAVSCECAEMTIFFSSNSSAPASARATISWDLPFCRGALSPICLAAHVPSDRSPIAACRTTSCHWSSSTPNDRDRSATSSQELALVGGGATLTRGGACSPTSATLRDLVNGVTHLRRRGQPVDLLKNVRQARSEGRTLVRVNLDDRGRQNVPESLQGGHAAPLGGCVDQAHDTPQSGSAPTYQLRV